MPQTLAELKPQASSTSRGMCFDERCSERLTSLSACIVGWSHDPPAGCVRKNFFRKGSKPRSPVTHTISFASLKIPGEFGCKKTVNRPRV